MESDGGRAGSWRGGGREAGRELRKEEMNECQWSFFAQYMLFGHAFLLRVPHVCRIDNTQ